jgi:hypothetical protein
LQSFAVHWQDTKLHVGGGCCSAAVQWQDTKLHARVAALLQWPILKLLY